MSKKIKIGVFGAGRGIAMTGVLSRHPDAELVAVCDKFAPILENCRQVAEQYDQKVTLYTDFDKFLEHDMDAVVLANYATEHAPYAVKVLDSGRHVTSEVLACETMAEGAALADAVERSGKIYTYSENYCYFRSTREMKKIYRRGDIGEFQHGEGEYVHDAESIKHRITYGQRDHWRNWVPATFYCTHAAGPILTVTGLRPVKVVAFDTPNLVNRYMGGRKGDGSMLCVQFENGATGKFLQGGYRRQTESIWYCVYGTNGQMESDRFGERENMIHTYIHNTGKSDYYRPTYRKEYEDQITEEGHSGSDFFTMQHFLDVILDREGKEEIIDVYQALDMTFIGTLGWRSAWEGNIPVEIPDFRDKAVREKYRNDNFCCDPKYAGPGQPDSSCSFGKIEVPDVTYEMVKLKYEHEFNLHRKDDE